MKVPVSPWSSIDMRMDAPRRKRSAPATRSKGARAPAAGLAAAGGRTGGLPAASEGARAAAAASASPSSGAQSGGALSAKLLRGDLLAEACPSRDVLKHVTSRWGVLVLMVLEQRTHRFSELRRAIGGVSERMLAQTLQWLEGDGLVARRALDVVPPHVEYSLTPLGCEAAGQVRGLADWIEVNLPRVLAAQAVQTGQV
jgi:DNA-binding HxlR family transcriptional regulator